MQASCVPNRCVITFSGVLLHEFKCALSFAMNLALLETTYACERVWHPWNVDHLLLFLRISSVC